MYNDSTLYKYRESRFTASVKLFSTPWSIDYFVSEHIEVFIMSKEKKMYACVYLALLSCQLKDKVLYISHKDAMSFFNIFFFQFVNCNPLVCSFTWFLLEYQLRLII